MTVSCGRAPARCMVHSQLHVHSVSRLFSFLFFIALAACSRTAEKNADKDSEYLFVWAGDSTEKSSDFLAVIDANPLSAEYGSVLASLPTGASGTHPHHTEAQLSANGHLLANGFHSGQSWLFDLTSPRTPKIIGSFGDLAGYTHPHTYLRLSNGRVLTTFQYKADSTAPAPMHMVVDTTINVEHGTGGLVEMDENGAVIRTGSAVDTAISDKRLFPYSMVEMHDIDRVVSTTTDMDQADRKATSQWVQFWRLSDLKLLGSIALLPGPGGHENEFTGEPHVLADGKSVYIHTFSCGLYLVRDIESAKPTSKLVKAFEGKSCGVPILAGHFWIQTLESKHLLVALDVTDVEHPREVSSLKFADGEEPHWISMDRTGKRIVLNSAGATASNRLYVVNFDPATGHLSMDDKFRDRGSAIAGVNFANRKWPHGWTGTGAPHGTVFSR